MKSFAALLAGAVIALVATGNASPATAAEPAPASGATPVPVSANHVTTGIDAKLQNSDAVTGTLSGRLVDGKTKAAAPNRKVWFFTTGGQRVQTTESDSAGRFSVRLPASTSGYAVCIYDNIRRYSRPTYINECLSHVWWDLDAPPAGSSHTPLAAGQHKDLGSIGLTRGAKITGTVRDTAGHLMSTDVYARSVSDPSVTAFAITMGAKEQYVLDGLPPSAKGYVVCYKGTLAYTDQGNDPFGRTGYAGSCHGGKPWNAGALPLTASPVKVGAAKIKRGVKGVLTVGGAIIGKVSSLGSGRGIGRIDVTAFDANGRPANTRFSRPNGRYIVDGLVPGRKYRVCATPFTATDSTRHSFFGKCFHGTAWDTGQAPSGRSVSVQRGHKTANVDFALKPAAAIDGTVVLSNGKPDTSARVYLFSGSGKQLATEPIDSLTKTPGHYNFLFLKPRSDGYVVCAVDGSADIDTSGTGSAPGCYGGAAWAGAARPAPSKAKVVQVRAGKRTLDVDIALPVGGAIRGHVRDAKSGDDINTVVYLYDSDGNFVQRAKANANYGEPADYGYEFAGVPVSAAGYQVCFSGNAAFAGYTGKYEYQGQCYANRSWAH